MTLTSQWSSFGAPSGKARRDLTVEGRFRGVQATVTFDLLVDEHSRRTRHQIEPVRDPHLIREISELPGSEWIHLAELTPELIKIARRRPELVATQLDSRGTWIRRRLAPTVVPTHVRISATRPRQGLEWASRFAGYASRTLHLPQLPRAAIALELECSYFGIGLSVSEPTEAVVVAPAPFLPERFSFASWHFSELVYAQWLETEPTSALDPNAPRSQDLAELLPGDQSW